jgi:MarR family transcriptional regulator, 2-MHQ and catechol-resistance regulon repressor
MNTTQEQDAITAIINLQRTLNKTMRQASLQEGITPQQATILRILQHEGAVPMRRIAEQLLVSRPNITGLVDRLEKKGLIEKKESDKDRRSTTIRLSIKGQELQIRINQNYATTLRTGLKALSTPEQQKLTNNLTKFVKEINVK